MTDPGSGAARGVVLPGAFMEVPGLDPYPVTLTIGTEGFDVERRDGARLSLGWEALGDARCGEPAFTPEGEPAVAISATVQGKYVRWVVPDLAPERATAINMLIDMRLAPATPPASTGGPPGASANGSGRPDPALPGLAPVGGWDRPVPSDAERRMRRTLKIMVVVVVLMVVGGLVVLAVGLSVPSHKHPRGDAHPATSPLVRSVQITAADLPSGWTSGATATGPLSGLLPEGQGTGLAPGTHVPAATASRFASCLRTAEDQDVIVGVAGARPSDRAASPVFTDSGAGNAALGVADVASDYGSAAEVQRAADELTQPEFARCLGRVVGEELVQSAASSAASQATLGSLDVSPLSLPAHHGVRAAGVDLSVPVTFTGGATSVEVDFVLVAGGRVEVTLVSYAAGGNFPRSLTRSLAADLEKSVAATVGT